MKRLYPLTSSFFLFASGVDKNWLAQCPEKEVTKYYSVGSLVFLTGLLGFISSSYAFHCLFDPVPIINPEKYKMSGGYVLLSVLCGLLWGTFVFLLDRAFVSTMSKNSSWIIQLLSAVPRFLLALLISISISKPIEILFFRDRIVSQIQTNMQDDVNNYVATVEKERSAINVDIGNYRKKIGDLNLEKKGPDQNEEKMLMDISACNQTNTGRQNTNNIAIQGINNQRSDYQESLHKLEILSNKTAQDSANLKLLEEKLVTLTKNTPKDQSYDCSTLSRTYTDYYNSRRRKLDEAITATTNLCRDDSLKLRKLDSTKAKNIAVISKSDTISFSQNLSAQIEALNSLINTDNTDKTSKKINEKTVGFWWYHFVIWMLFLAIEIAPISMKLIMPRGEYDEIAKAHYQSIKYQCETVIKKKEAAFKEYLEKAKQENIVLLKDFFEKVRFHRTRLLDNEISDWSTGEVSYEELQRSVFKKFSDYEPDLNDSMAHQNEAAPSPVQVSINGPVITNQPKSVSQPTAVVSEEKTPSPAGANLVKSLRKRLATKIKNQMDDEITKIFFNAARIIACVLIPAVLIKIIFPQDFDKLIDLVKKIKE